MGQVPTITQWDFLRADRPFVVRYGTVAGVIDPFTVFYLHWSPVPPDSWLRARNMRAAITPVYSLGTEASPNAHGRYGTICRGDMAVYTPEWRWLLLKLYVRVSVGLRPTDRNHHRIPACFFSVL